MDKHPQSQQEAAHVPKSQEVSTHFVMENLILEWPPPQKAQYRRLDQDKITLTRAIDTPGEAAEKGQSKWKEKKEKNKESQGEDELEWWRKEYNLRRADYGKPPEEQKPKEPVDYPSPPVPNADPEIEQRWINLRLEIGRLDKREEKLR